MLLFQVLHDKIQLPQAEPAGAATTQAQTKEGSPQSELY